MNNYEYLSETERLLLSQCPYNLTLTIEELTKPSAKKHENPGKPPRPQNSWIIFRKDYEANIRLLNPDVKQNVIHTAKGCSVKWKSQSIEVKNFFKILEKIACKNHEQIYPNYKYRPKNAKDSSYKKFIFWEQKKYAFISTKSSSTNDNSFQEAAEINASTSLTNNMTNNLSNLTSPAIHNNLSINSVTTLPILINNFSTFSNNQFIFALIPISTTPFISSPSSHVQISIPEYLTYNSTYMAGNLSNFSFDDCDSFTN
ncbi:12825_t:CDS:1 [Ambispora gerdemannii]|uniref:12825_t:CDS:1 n=1 Tax=Ambispora gerdemannii TaxID=144530 RepID=A0A9N9AKL4_9GLOM|nr:12825_t:CDS:1 [Ambispora gerdemannii]